MSKRISTFGKLIYAPHNILLNVLPVLPSKCILLILKFNCPGWPIFCLEHNHSRNGTFFFVRCICGPPMPDEHERMVWNMKMSGNRRRKKVSNLQSYFQGRLLITTPPILLFTRQTNRRDLEFEIVYYATKGTMFCCPWPRSEIKVPFMVNCLGWTLKSMPGIRIATTDQEPWWAVGRLPGC